MAKAARKSSRVKYVSRRRARRHRRARKSQAIVHVASQVPAPQIISAVPTIQRAVQSMEQVRRFVVKCLNTDLRMAVEKLKPGEQLDKEVRERLEIDWGTIPTVDKPFLKQPGAEKFMLWLNLRPTFSKHEIELPNGHLEVVAHVVMRAKKTGEEVFEGPDCSCTTMESNYRFRYQERPEDEPQPTQEEAAKLKAQGLGKWKKKAVWVRGKKTDDKWVWMDRVENPNIYDERNKVRQIAEKRAVVKCVRNMGGMSELFISDPGEWDIPDEDFGSPFEDANYTAGGRKIIRPGEHEEHSREAQQRVAQEKIDDLKERMGSSQAAPKQPSAEATQAPEDLCNGCGKPGHVSKECPERQCYNCKEKGHWGQDCPKPREKATTAAKPNNAKAARKPQQKEPKGKPRGKQAEPRQEIAVKGSLRSISSGVTAKNQTFRRITFYESDATYSLFDNKTVPVMNTAGKQVEITYFDLLAKAPLGTVIECAVVMSGEYKNIKSISRIGRNEWDETGLPVSRRDGELFEREPGSDL